MIKGEKVTLDTIKRSNIEWLRQQRNDPELRQYFREWKDISEDQQEKWYASRGNNTNQSHVYFEILSNETGEIVGCTGLHYINWRLRSAEFSIFLARSARGAGYGYETLSLLFNYGFSEMNLHKIWAEVYDNNKAISLYTNGLGMKVDGKSRHSQFINGKYMDSTLLSILDNEWFERN